MLHVAIGGAPLHSLRVPFGYWEAKDASENLEWRSPTPFFAPKWRRTIAEHLPKGVIERREESSVV